MAYVLRVSHKQFVNIPQAVDIIDADSYVDELEYLTYEFDVPERTHVGRDRLGCYHLYKDGFDCPADLYVGASGHVRFTFGKYDGVFLHGGDIVTSIR